MDPKLARLYLDPDPYFVSGPFSRRDALMYCYARTSVGDALPSQRELATVWGWHRTQVRRFFEQLAKLGVVPTFVPTSVPTQVVAPLELSPPPVPAVVPSSVPTPRQVDPAVIEVFEYWATARKKVLGLNGSAVPMKLTTKRRSKITARLGEGYTPDQLKRAIQGCMSSDYHLTNKYLDIELICRDQTKLEMFLHKPTNEGEEWVPDLS